MSQCVSFDELSIVYANPLCPTAHTLITNHWSRSVPSILLRSINQEHSDTLPRNRAKHASPFSKVPVLPYRCSFPFRKPNRTHQNIVHPASLHLLVHKIKIRELSRHVGVPEHQAEYEGDAGKGITDADCGHGDNLARSVSLHHRYEICVSVGHQARWRNRCGEGAVCFAWCVESDNHRVYRFSCLLGECFLDVGSIRWGA